jgi:hypothetical protein
MTMSNFTSNRSNLTIWSVSMLVCVRVLGAERDDLNGVWLFTGSDTPTNLYLTAAGKETMNSYEPLTDDDDNYCIPVSFTNIMHTPSPPFEIRLHEDLVEMNYEFLDVRRRVPLVDWEETSVSLETAPYSVEQHPRLGRSLARFDDTTLVIETRDVEAGYLDTLGVPGLPQSAEMSTEEKYIPNGDSLEVVVTHHDPINYTRDLVVRYGFHRIDSEILEWNCEPEAASYDRFLENND